MLIRSRKGTETKTFPQTRRHVAALLKPMILNLGHQHSKTRHVTLKAVGVLVVCGSDDLPKIMKARSV